MTGYQPVLEQPQVGKIRLLFVPLLILAGAGVTSSIAGGIGEGVDLMAIVILIVASFAYVGIARRAARSDPLGDYLFQVLILAWLAKLAAMGAKHYILFHVYNGASDATGYHQSGIEISGLLASGAFPQLEKFWGTQFVELFAGFLYLLIGPTFIGGWIVFSFMGNMGMLLQYKAFVTALPAANRRLYMYMIFFAPSILMWTNTMGKDSLMALFLGMVVYGAARTYARGLSLGSMVWAGIGLVGMVLVRAHVAAIIAVALAAFVVLRPIRAGMLTPIIRIATIAGIVVLAVLVVRTAASFINLEDVSVEGVTEFLEQEQQQSGQGGSAFEGSLPTTPQGLAIGVVTVLFRPFPWESAGLLGFGSALEGFVLMLLIVWRIRGVLGAIWEARRNAYLALIVVYIAIFVVFFSVTSNFGILVRQRVQVLPFVFALVAYRGSRFDEELAASQNSQIEPYAE